MLRIIQRVPLAIILDIIYLHRTRRRQPIAPIDRQEWTGPRRTESHSAACSASKAFTRAADAFMRAADAFTRASKAFTRAADA